MNTNAFPPASDAPPPLPGMPLVMNSLTFVLPAMSHASVERHGEAIEALMMGRSELSMAKQISLVVSVLHEALLRNYPGILRDFVAEHTSAANFGSEACAEFLKLSGLLVPTAAQPRPNGEGAATLGESIGAPSTRTS